MTSEAHPAMPHMSVNKSPDENTEQLRFHPLLSAVAHVLSVICHPLFVPVIGTWLVIKTHPFAFAGFDHKSLFRIYGSVASNTVILTGFTVLILKQLKFISSIRLPTRRDRVVPYVATMTFYFWAFMVFKHQPQIPGMLTAFLLGNFIAVILAFLSNLMLKISMHALGMGGLLGLACCFIGDPYYNITLPLMVIILVTGAVCTSRLILGEHSLREIYLGALFGVFAQLLASWLI
jgi:hypothetical protein